MKLHWFSPLPPVRSKVAQYTMRALPALAKVADVTLWTDQGEWNETIERYARIEPITRRVLDWVEMNRADLVVFNMADNPLFHSHIYDISRQFSGLVIVHDASMQNLFLGMYRDWLRTPDLYVRAMHTYHGFDGEDAAHEILEDTLSPADVAADYPLTCHATENALGLLVHSRDLVGVLGRGDGPPLIYVPPFFDPTESEDTPTDDTAAEAFAHAIEAFAGRAPRLRARTIAPRLAARVEGEFPVWLLGDAHASLTTHALREARALVAMPPLDRASAGLQTEISGALPAAAMRARVSWANQRRTFGTAVETTIHVHVKNLSRIAWPALGREESSMQIRVHSQWLDEDGGIVARDSVGAPLPRDVYPFEEVEIPIVVKPPRQSGFHDLEVHLVQEGVAIFGRGMFQDLFVMSEDYDKQSLEDEDDITPDSTVDQESMSSAEPERA